MKKDKIENIPDKVYIQLGEDVEPGTDYNDLDGLTFSSEKVFRNDIEYLRRKTVIANIKVTRNAMILDGYEEEDSCIKFMDGLIKEIEL